MAGSPPRFPEKAVPPVQIWRVVVPGMNRRSLVRALAIVAAAFLSVRMVAGQDPGLNRRGSGMFDPLGQLERGGPAGGPVEAGGTVRPMPAAAVDDYGEQEILVRADLWQPWAFGMSTGLEYQGNAALAPETETDDFLLRESASGRGTFALTDALYIDLGLQQQLYRYDELDVLDFDRIDADAGFLWVWPQSLPGPLAGSAVTLKGSWYRMAEAGSFSEELFANAGVAAGLLKSMPLGRNHTLLASATADVSVFASDAAPQRDEFAALAAWQARWFARWESSCFVRMVLYDYDAHDDRNVTLAASLDYVLKPWCRVGISGNVIFNDSDVGAFDYWNSGIGANLRMSLRF